MQPTRIENPWQPLHDIALLTSIRLDFKNAGIGSVPEGWQIVAGDPAEFSVAHETEQKINIVRARSQQEPITGIYRPWTLTGLEYEAAIRVRDNGAKVGLVFGYKDPANHCRVMLDTSTGTIRVSQLVDGVESVLGEQAAQIAIGPWLHLALEADKGQVEIEFEDEREQQSTVAFTVPLSQIPTGSVGFYLPANNAADFRSFEIEHER